MSKIDISILQLDTVWEKPQANLQIIENHISNNRNSDLYVLPEMFNTGFTNNVANQSEKIDGFSVTKLKEIAISNQVAICGSLILEDSGKYYNSFLFITPDGKTFRYDKRHLFKIGGEAEMFTGGSKRVVVEYLGFRFLLQVCYDLRFPVWSRNRNDYDAIIYVANWPAGRRFVYDTLLRARAIENQSFVIAANRIGSDGQGVSYDGGSCVINAKGESLIVTEDNKELVKSISIDLVELKEFRAKFPAYLDADDFTL